MDVNVITSGLLWYMMLIVLLTFHEFGHAWTAMKCGDDTAYLQGRVSLNPLVHIDPIGTVLMPLLAVFLPASAASFIIGWAKPVPVNTNNLRRPQVDDMLVTLAGPGMNLLLAIVLMFMARILIMVHLPGFVKLLVDMSQLSLLLCFFNLLLPIPPLDGSQIMRVLTRMPLETYIRLCIFGPFILIAVLQIPAVRLYLGWVTNWSLVLIARGLNFPDSYF